jgi:hypothetical protein
VAAPQLSPLLHAIEHPTVLADSLAQGLRPARRGSEVPLLSFGDAFLFFVVPAGIAVILGTLLRSRRFGSGAKRVMAIPCVVCALIVLIGLFAPIDNGSAPFEGVIDGTSQDSVPVTPSALQGDLSQLQAIYDDIVPALQYAGAAGRRVLDPESAAQVLAENRGLMALDGFVTNFSELYGVGVLITQQAESSSANPNTADAMRWLDWLAVVAAAVFLLCGGAALAFRRRNSIAAPTREADGALVFSNMAEIRS